jgi:hypothetical protein
MSDGSQVKYADLLICRDSGDLKLMMDALATYWYSIPVPERPKGDVGQLASDLLSYHRRLDDLPKEYITTIWAGVRYLLDKLEVVDARKLVEESKIVKNPQALTPGKYWVIDGEFHRCENGWKDYVLENQDVFSEKLGVDGWRFLRAKHSVVDDLLRLILVSGAAMSEVGMSNKMKYVKYQCCNDLIPMLKGMAGKMAAKTSFFRIYDPSKPYEGFNTGISFVLRH